MESARFESRFGRVIPFESPASWPMEDQAASTLGGNLRPTDVGGFSSRSARQRFQRLYADGLVDRDEID